MIVKGLTTPLSRWLQGSWLFVQVLGDLCIVSYWIDTLVLKTKGNTYATLLHHPFLFKGKPMHAQEVAIMISGVVTEEIFAKSRQNLISRQLADFWHRFQEDIRQVKTYQVPIINSSPSHYIICHLPFLFLSPISKMIFENLCLFFAPLPLVSSHLLLVCLCVGLIACHNGSR